MHRIKLTARAKREVKLIKARHQEALDAAFEELKHDPYLGKPLSRELTGKFTYKIGSFRFIYTINNPDKIIHVITAGHRSTIYK